MYYLKTSASFDSAHFLAGYRGKCSNLHGHRWTIEVQISGETLQESGTKRGMLLDFGDVKHAVRELADKFPAACHGRSTAGRGLPPDSASVPPHCRKSGEVVL